MYRHVIVLARKDQPVAFLDKDQDSVPIVVPFAVWQWAAND